MYDIAQEHCSFGSGRQHNDRASWGVSGSGPDVHAGKDRFVSAPGFETVGHRREQMRRGSAAQEGDGHAVVERRGPHEELPVGLVATVGGVFEQATLSVGGPSEMVEMEVSQ